MSEAKHAPGPWQARDNAGAFTIIIAADNLPVVWPMGGIDNVDNARLIAAAPDLLAALKGWMEDLEDNRWEDYAGEQFEEGQKRQEKRIEAARAAIAKAEGTT